MFSFLEDEDEEEDDEGDYDDDEDDAEDDEEEEDDETVVFFHACIHQDSKTCSDMIQKFAPGPAPWLDFAQVYFDMLEADPLLPPRRLRAPMALTIIFLCVTCYLTSFSP